MVVEERVAEVGIEPNGSIFIRPTRTTFEHVYRAAMQVGWDDAHRRLFSPPPKDWSHVQWFQRIIVAAANEYGVHLKLGPETSWSNVPPELRATIEAAQEGASDPGPLEKQRQRRDAEAQARTWQLQDTLADAAQLWEQKRYAEYARLLAPVRQELSPAQVKRVELAKKRGGLV